MCRSLLFCIFILSNINCNSPKPPKKDVNSCANRGTYPSCHINASGDLNNCLPANTPQDWNIFRKSNDQTTIRTEKQWRNCLKNPGCTPLSQYNQAIIDRFTQGLTFDSLGLTQSDYREVSEVLTFPEVKKLFSQFGIGLRLLEEQICQNRPKVWCMPLGA